MSLSLRINVFIFVCYIPLISGKRSDLIPTKYIMKFLFKKQKTAQILERNAGKKSLLDTFRFNIIFYILDDEE